MTNFDCIANYDDVYFTGEWLREATSMEYEMEELYLTEHRLWYQLDLSSQQPLREEDARCTLDHLYRKVPNLAIAFGHRYGKLWLKRATNRNIDFEVVKGQTVDEIREFLKKYSFNGDTGPTICVRLLEDSSVGAFDVHDLEPSFPCKYHIIFGIRHVIADGTSTMNIMRFFITLLNDVISNTPVDDSQPLGTFDSGEQTYKLVLEKKVLIEADPDLKQSLQREFQFKKENLPIVLKLSPISKGPRKTASIINVLDTRSTTQFLQMCRQEEVTVNSAISALVNIAIVEVLVEHGVEQDSYILQNFHTINVRRYWQGDTSNALGCHIGFPLIDNVDTPRDLKNQFWQYTKSLHSNLRNDIVSGKILLNDAFVLLTSPQHLHEGENVPTTRRYEGDYVTSSMGEVTEIVTEGGEHVRITNILRSTAIHSSEFPLLFNYHTFRGRLTFSFDYNTEVLDATVANRIQSKIIKHLKGLK